MAPVGMHSPGTAANIWDNVWTMIEAVREYLTMATSGALSEERRLHKLAEALDKLVCAYRLTPATAPDIAETREPPQGNYKSFRQAARRAFPDCGLYPWIDLAGKIDQAAMVGDALDDIADIAMDLSEVAWRWEHVGAADANWYFRMLYETHWGAHAHALRSYVYARIWR